MFENDVDIDIDVNVKSMINVLIHTLTFPFFLVMLVSMNCRVILAVSEPLMTSPFLGNSGVHIVVFIILLQLQSAAFFLFFRTSIRIIFRRARIGG